MTTQFESGEAAFSATRAALDATGITYQQVAETTLRVMVPVDDERAVAVQCDGHLLGVSLAVPVVQLPEPESAPAELWRWLLRFNGARMYGHATVTEQAQVLVKQPILPEAILPDVLPSLLEATVQGGLEISQFLGGARGGS